MSTNNGFVCVLFITLYVITHSSSPFFEHRNHCRDMGHDILLIINFNHAHYHNIDFLHKLYSPYFPHIVFYGPTDNNPRVHLCPAGYNQGGFYAYTGMADAMQRYPEYHGYLWLNDDCALFVWHLIGLDKNKIWACPPGFPNVAKNISSGAYPLSWGLRVYWCWWKRNYTSINAVYENLPPHNRTIIEKNYGTENIPCGTTEAFYIPKKYVDDFIALSDLCITHTLFIEIAVPLMIASLDHTANQETMNIIWGLSERRMKQITNFNYPWNFNHNSHFFKDGAALCHPLKFSQESCQTFIQKLYQAVLG